MENTTLIERAIESAKCRIYRVRANVGKSLEHQIKADNQAEIQQVTIDALEKQISKKPYIEEYDYGNAYVCTICETFIHYVDDDEERLRFDYCPSCGQKIDWGLDD